MVSVSCFIPAEIFELLFILDFVSFTEEKEKLKRCLYVRDARFLIKEAKLFNQVMRLEGIVVCNIFV